MNIMTLGREINNLNRTRQILSVLVTNGFGAIIDKINLTHLLPLEHRFDRKPESKRSMPVRVRMLLEKLGGAFVKLGQLLSLRPDLIPAPYCNELRNLQDNVKPFSNPKKIIERELKGSVDKIFKEFSVKPIASASVGQVHVARLKDGSKVAVKIQRPNIREVMREDIDILYFLAKHIEKHMEFEFVRPVEIVREFEKYTTKELDYMHEAKNIDMFYNAFKTDKLVKIPKVYWDYTTDKVLVMEFIEGKKIDDLKAIAKLKLDRKRIAENTANMLFKQIFIHGLFHADPHPGNIFVLPKNKLGLIDFGIVGVIDKRLREKLTTIFVGFIQGDIDQIADGFMDLGMVDDDFDMDKLKEDLVDTLSEYYNASLAQMDLPLIITKCINLAIHDKINVPSNVVLLGKALVTVEGFCKELDPEFNIVKVAKPFITDLVKKKTNPQYVMKHLAKKSMKLGRFLTRVPDISTNFFMKLSKVDSDLSRIDRGLGNISSEIKRSAEFSTLGKIVAVLVLAAALTIGFESQMIYGIPQISFILFTLAGLLFTIMLLRHKTP